MMIASICMWQQKVISASLVCPELNIRDQKIETTYLKHTQKKGETQRQQHWWNMKQVQGRIMLQMWFGEFILK